jgi:hypothetical protein
MLVAPPQQSRRCVIGGGDDKRRGKHRADYLHAGRQNALRQVGDIREHRRRQRFTLAANHQTRGDADGGDLEAALGELGPSRRAEDARQPLVDGKALEIGSDAIGNDARRVLRKRRDKSGHHQQRDDWPDKRRAGADHDPDQRQRIVAARKAPIGGIVDEMRQGSGEARRSRRHNKRQRDEDRGERGEDGNLARYRRIAALQRIVRPGASRAACPSQGESRRPSARLRAGRCRAARR